MILHGKKKYWLKGGNYHYHHGMRAGDNTLDTLLARLLVRTILRTQRVDAAEYRKDYVTFMTTPDSHNDVYAGTCHRMFFANRQKGLPEEQCADNDGHNVDAIDGLINVTPVALALHARDSAAQDQALRDVILVIRNSEVLVEYAKVYRDLLLAVLRGADLRQSVVQAAKRLRFDVEAVAQNGDDPMTACYINSSFPALLVLAYKYGNDPVQCLLKGANAGGENVNRNSVLGALLGAAHGFRAWPESLVNGLTKSAEYQTEISEFEQLTTSGKL